jgi:hypothetical protein
LTDRFIFIVGASRSGTTLMRTILNRSDQIAIAMENHFLGHLVPREGARHKFRQFGDLSDDRNARRLVEYVYSGQMRRSLNRHMSSQWAWIVKNIDKDDFLQAVLDSDRTMRGLFVVMMKVFADYRGKPIMGEKTPAHLRHVPTLVAWFPGARVIHLLRDPRAVFVSELRRRQQPPFSTPYRQLGRSGLLFRAFVLVQTTLACLDSARRFRNYRAQYSDNYYALRFEDLVSEPADHVKQICEFVGVDYQPTMLDQAVVSQGAMAGQPGFDLGAASRWREVIPSWADTWFRFWFREHLEELGYSR